MFAESIITPSRSLFPPPASKSTYDLRLQTSYSLSSQEFSGSLPISLGRSVNIWGCDKPSQFVDYDRKSFHCEDNIDDSTPVGNISVESNHIPRSSKVRKSTLLGLGYNYHSEKDVLLIPPSEKPEKNDKQEFVGENVHHLGLSNSIKVSKHTTTFRKLRPEKKVRKKSAQFQEEAKPLPKVEQRKNLPKIVDRRIKEVSDRRSRRASIIKKASFRELAADMLAVVADETADPFDPFSETTKKNYFGPLAKKHFFDLYAISKRSLQMFPDTVDLPVEQKTPRTIYLREVTKQNLIPVPIILRNEKNPKGLFLGHRGLGDAKLLPVIEVIPCLPVVESIDLSDNRLTDMSLMKLANNLQKLPNLTYLNLSYNKIDQSSAVIMDYLVNTDCKLKSLLLNGADVDDAECYNLARAIMKNKSITSLSLTNNLIGAKEQLNVVNPSLITGAEALGQMLTVNRCLEYLDLSWNYIRLDSAISFSESLMMNHTLSTLILAYNAFGDLPTQYLGQALKINNSITYLDLSYNSINPRAATVLANALIQNDSLTHLILDGNVLGDVGAQAMVAAVQRASGENRVLSVSFSNCECNQEAKGVFNAANPSGTYVVDLSEPYGQMVAEECLYLANYRAGCHLMKLEYTTPDGSKVDVKLERLTSSTHAQLDIYVKLLGKCLLENKVGQQQHCKLVQEKLKTLFEHFDLYPNDEFLLRIASFLFEALNVKIRNGMKLAEIQEEYSGSMLTEIFLAVFQMYDNDGSGTMDLDEFIRCLADFSVQLERKYAKKLMRDFDTDKSGTIDRAEFAMLMVNEFCKTDLARGELVDAVTKKPWIVPLHGQLFVDMYYQCEKATIYDVSHDEGIHSIIKAIQDAKSDEQREVIFNQAVTSPYYFMSAQQALMLFEEVGKHNDSHLDVLARVLPQLVNSEQCHRFVDSVLNEEGKFALRVQMGQIFNTFMGLPNGHYVFELKSKQKIVEGRCLSAIWSEEVKINRLKNVDTSQRGDFSNFRNEAFNSTPIALTAHWFASCTIGGKVRCDYVSTAKPHLGIYPLSEKRYRSLLTKLNLDSILKLAKNISKFDEAPLPSSLSLIHVREYFIEYMDSSHHYHSIYPVERPRDASRTLNDPSVRPLTPDSLKDVESPPPISKLSPITPYAYSKLLLLQLSLPTVYLTNEQAIEIMMMFPEDNYIRVQAIICMFSRIIDYEKNGVKFLQYLSPDERQEIFHRLGILNVVDTLYPDLYYRLDLRRWEHRTLCKILIVLAVEEPGDNWLNVEYRWTKYDPNVPGWTLPVLWLSPDEDNNGDGGPRRFGWVSFTYCSTGPGCSPVIPVRLEQRKKLLVGIKRDPVKIITKEA